MKSLTKEEREYLIDQVQQHFEMERNEVLGELAADHFVQWMAEEAGPIFYNKGITDARRMVEQKVMNIDEDLLSLERPAGRPKRR
ncbi:DUF2164 domain-containing protein [Halobacillus sp. ACCC02827]|uniref:DUF2164 domain-containing protein n=1 Tax=Bacillaceae TaxID=186817 RepID=UPI0002A4D014|nr:MULTISPECIES: DUF2164 domain-containing protein [Bacillaceae]ELK48695.1 hypothetical protein D479_01907 [Halobacillus sp. BAB-2008]QHT45364.1 DUF2164 domain-containing protein [Bacillus sp. SB49]WJE16149.1 DUF2164 domain-containing protein [Halobacillus sp. ACCC02827]